MNSFILSRALGTISPQTFARAHNTYLVYALQPSSDIALSIKPPSKHLGDERLDDGQIARESVAHPAGVNSITIDKFEGK